MSQTVIFGAGAIGGFVGAQIGAAGGDISFYARPSRAAALRAEGLRTTDGVRLDAVDAFDDPARLADAGLVVLCVKSTALGDVVQILAEHLPAGVPVVCLLNGLSPAKSLATALPKTPVTPGMVPFNVSYRPDGLHLSSSGEIALEKTTAGRALADMLAPTLCPATLHENIAPVLAGKLLLNLNNPVNALSGKPLMAQLRERPYRLVYAAALKEALRIFKAAGMAHRQTAALPAERIVRVLQWPNLLFNKLALPRQGLDEDSQTSMAQDLEAGRETEIDTINGDVVAIAEQAGRAAPINARLVSLIKSAQSGGRRVWSGPDLYEAVIKG